MIIFSRATVFIPVAWGGGGAGGGGVVITLLCNSSRLSAAPLPSQAYILSDKLKRNRRHSTIECSQPFAKREVRVILHNFQ